LSKLAEAVIKQLEYFNKIEYRPASYKDLQVIEIDGKQCTLKYGTLRNMLSLLKREGKVERYYNSKVSFFVIKGIKFGKHLTNHVMTENNKTKLSDAIKKLPENNRGLHDIHISFHVQDLWTIMNESKRFKINEYNKGILLPHFNIDGLKITAIVHHTDTITVSVACSKNPVSTAIEDAHGVIRLAAALARVQERIQRVVDECGQLLSGGYESILIPDYSSWKVKMWHFSVDSPNYKEVEFCMTWKDGQDVLLRDYSKKNFS
jgi:hypothetical protein